MRVSSRSAETDTVESRSRVLAGSPLFRELDAALLDELVKAGRLLVYERNGALHRQTDQAAHLHLLGEGRARVMRISADREITLGYRGPGQLVGEESLVDGAFHTEARAAERVETLRLPVRVLSRVSRESAELAYRLMELMGEHRNAAEDRLEAQLTRTVESRVSEFLLDAAERHGARDPRGTLVEVKFTHLEISSFVGATRETVTLVLGELRRRGIIAFDRRRVVVKNPAGLRELL
jgi:CRP-like cAMP-binding protein